MNDLRTAAQQALEALDWHSKHGANWASIDEATEALRAALAEPVQEPSAWTIDECDRVVRTLRYIEGIAARGEGRPMREGETLEQFLLGYVQKLEALAEPVQEPVAWLYRDHNGELRLNCIKPKPHFAFPVYTAPPRCPNCASLEAQNTELDAKLAELERKPLTEEEIRNILNTPMSVIGVDAYSFARAIERAHGIK